ncbi:MAG: dihydropteroate synthase [Mariprofundaceae bacterium]
MAVCIEQTSRLQRQASEPAWMMGVLNCTPDSFSDGGRFINVEAAVKHGLQMQHDGALLIDVGGESTRPGAALVSEQLELQRVIPVIKALVEKGCQVSIDTRKSEVMRQAVQAGACMINDVSALSFDAKSISVAAESQVDICLMHMQGSPESMQDSPQYDDVLLSVMNYFEQRIELCLQAGIKQSALVLDPGIGFGKRLQDNLSLIANLGVLRDYFNVPLLLGVSRKSFIGMVTGAELEQRELESAVAGSLGVLQGADGLRVHDVKTQRRAGLMAAAIADAKVELTSFRKPFNWHRG